MARNIGSPIAELSRHSFGNVDQRFTEPLIGLKAQQMRDTESWLHSPNLNVMVTLPFKSGGFHGKQYQIK